MIRWINDYQATLQDLGIEEGETRFPTKEQSGMALLIQQYIRRMQATRQTWSKNILEARSVLEAPLVVMVQEPKDLIWKAGNASTSAACHVPGLVQESLKRRARTGSLPATPDCNPCPLPHGTCCNGMCPSRAAASGRQSPVQVVFPTLTLCSSSAVLAELR